ncbi:DUF2797 domain-containing protein [Halogeometricum limi]|uniref:DUF2797 domain-containing protein n=1 Tax=Halogeometricum limi TaxID=555875 RepID=A0A1I6GQ84_9EURY|nr:DUF2797 domain-containing protein [Halogeometricum limi]SFR44289.1 Protein of unknown function [Halogeometricum limi]
MQFVGYDTAGPGLFLASDGDVEYVSVEPGDRLRYTLGDRHCAGVVVDDEHRACGAETVPYCRDHRSTWVCAKCTGTCLKDEMDCHDPHAVYLAAFAPDVFKVGVTKEWRLETRLREQGADRGAHLETVANGRIAREREAGLAESIPDRVRVPTKRAGLHRDVDDDAWESLCAAFDVRARFDFDYGLGLESQPVDERIATGVVRGVQGRLLVLDHAGSTYAVDLRDLVGHEVTAEATTRDVQSSLGAWG